MLKRLKTLTEEVIHKNPWWTYKHDTYELPNGEVGNYYYGDTNGNVIIIPVLQDGRILLIKQYRYLVEELSVELPGGGIQEDLTALEAAAHELAEETGAVVDEFISVGHFYPTNGLMTEKTQVYLGHVVEQHEPHPDESEEIEVLSRLPHEIDQMIRQNDMTCGQTIAAWSMARPFIDNTDAVA